MGILPNIELKLEIPSIMLVCRFEISWSTNKNLKSAYNISRMDGLTNNGRTPDISISAALLCGGRGTTIQKREPLLFTKVTNGKKHKMWEKSCVVFKIITSKTER